MFLLSLLPINLYVKWLAINQIVLIVTTIIKIVCLNNVVMFILYTFILCVFNLYDFLSSNCIYQFCIHSFYINSICMLFFPQIVFISFVFSQFVYFIAKGQDVFRQTKKQPWPFTPLKRLYASLVTYKGKFNKRIISFFEHYEDFKVWTSLSFNLYWFKSNVCIQIILLNAELHADSALNCTSVCTSSICSPTWFESI